MSRESFRLSILVGVTLLSWALLIAFVSTMTGGQTLLAPGQPSWQEYQSQAGRYSILMPGKPKEQTQTNDAEVGTLQTYIAIIEDRTGAYLTAYTDYPADLVRAALKDDLLDSVVQGGAASVKGKLTRQTDFALDTFPGREAEIDAPAQGVQPAMHIKSRYYLVNNRLYQVMVLAPQNQKWPESAQKFLDSFKLSED